MAILEVRRHSERSDAGDESSALSERGRALALQVARSAGPYAFVISSRPPRAQETARLIGGRLDRLEEGLLPDVARPLDGVRVKDLSGYRDLLRENGEARRIGEQQTALWSNLILPLRDDEIALAVSHGGVLELGATFAAERIGLALDGPTFGYCEGVRVAFRRGEPHGLELVRI